MTNDVLLAEETAVEPLREPEAPPLLAPWWHTVALLALLVTWALTGRSSSHAVIGQHLPMYASSIMLSWLLLGAATAGLYRRGQFFSEMLRSSRLPWIADVAIGGVIYIGILITMAIIVTVFALTRHDTSLWQQTATGDRSHVLHEHGSPDDGGSSSPVKGPATSTPSKTSLSRAFDQRTLKAIAPKDGRELFGWLLLSLSAGVCEELVFRGYLLRQSLLWIQRAGIAPKMAMGIAAVLTSLLFGSLHLYEGVGGAAMVAFLGLVYSVVSLWTGNLRAAMAAHVMQDFLAGVVLFALHRVT